MTLRCCDYTTIRPRTRLKVSVETQWSSRKLRSPSHFGQRWLRSGFRTVPEGNHGTDDNVHLDPATGNGQCILGLSRSMSPLKARIMGLFLGATDSLRKDRVCDGVSQNYRPDQHVFLESPITRSKNGDASGWVLASPTGLFHPRSAYRSTLFPLSGNPCADLRSSNSTLLALSLDGLFHRVASGCESGLSTASGMSARAFASASPR